MSRRHASSWSVRICMTVSQTLASPPWPILSSHKGDLQISKWDRDNEAYRETRDEYLSVPTHQAAISRTAFAVESPARIMVDISALQFVLGRHLHSSLPVWVWRAS